MFEAATSAFQPKTGGGAPVAQATDEVTDLKAQLAAMQAKLDKLTS